MNLYGIIRKDEGLIIVISIGESHQYLPVIGQLGRNISKTDNFEVMATVNGADTKFYYYHGQWTEAHTIIVDLDDTFIRTPFQDNHKKRLRESTVAVIGVGSGGSRMVVGLARDGVGSFRLVDPDIVAIQNISRHECTLLDLERFKVEAVKERILSVNPLAKVEVFPVDIFKENLKAKNQVFNGANLVIASTDTKLVQMRINSECWKRKIPSLYTGCYDEARAGEILYVIPGETTVCYECLRGGTNQQVKTRKYDYSRARNVQEYRGEPGLNAAINLISDVAEQYAIAMLLRKEECEIARLIDPKKNLLFIGGALGEGFYYLKDTNCFKKPFDFVVPVIKEPWRECGTCQINRGKA